MPQRDINSQKQEYKIKRKIKIIFFCTIVGLLSAGGISYTALGLSSIITKYLN